MVKTPEEIEKIRASCKKCKSVLKELGCILKPGISTYEIEEKAVKLLKKVKEAEFAFKNYNGYPANLCVSINEEVVHGIPSRDKFLMEGDIVSIDIGLVYKGYYSDYAETFPVGDISPEKRRLVEAACKAFREGFAMALPGMQTGDIGAAVQRFAEENKFSVVKEFVGHGIGAALHEFPEIPNFGFPGTGAVLQANTVIAIEPMLNQGKADVKILSDGWTVVTRDKSCSAHYEECVLITGEGPELLAS